MNFWPDIECPGRRIGYARVSTKDQKLRMQLEALNALDCAEIFRDHGVSGAKDSRPGLDAMLRILRPGDSVVVFKLDRLGRSVMHLSGLLTRFQHEGVHFVSLSEGINTTTPGGKLAYHIFSAVAEFQRDIIVENTTCGLMAARQAGKRLGRPFKLSPDAIAEAHRLMALGEVDIQSIAALNDVHPRTLERAFARLETEAA
ncbi:recombinase family protein [Marivibrio halodurans]|uniref:Recombinase family protein n=1 Tax=Marivibrio halodurans TaxID=2039722 RepID=A0A8J7V4J2_9PROT|nr:recombinase family protein [Marivibrio halodurans]MBP5859137.1 recombinase family protein [Marivibrio halodurans]